MCVCACVRVCVRVCVCVHACVCLCKHGYVPILVHTSACVIIHVCMCVCDLCEYISMNLQSVCECTDACTYRDAAGLTSM